MSKSNKFELSSNQNPTQGGGRGPLPGDPRMKKKHLICCNGITSDILVIVTETAAREMSNLLDGDDTTCTDSESLYGTRGHYSCVITWEKNSTNDQRTKIDVHFNTTVNCRKRKVRIWRFKIRFLDK